MGTYRKKTKDSRFAIARREALIAVGLAIFQFIWWYGFAYGLGSKPVEEYRYILGFPAWFFFSCILGFFVIIGILIFLVQKVLKEVPFETNDEGEQQ